MTSSDINRYQGAGLLMNIIVRIFYNTTNTLGPVGVLPNIDFIESLLDHTDTRLWSMIPALVDEIGETPKVLAKFAKAKFIIASGGRCPVSLQRACVLG